MYVCGGPMGSIFPTMDFYVMWLRYVLFICMHVCMYVCGGPMGSIFPTMDFCGDVIEVRFIYMYACMYECIWWPYGFHISDHGFLWGFDWGTFYFCACMYVCMYVSGGPMGSIFPTMDFMGMWLRNVLFLCMYVCMYVCMHVCMYACMHVCMYVVALSVQFSDHGYVRWSAKKYIHTCIHTHTYTYMHRALDMWYVQMQTIHMCDYLLRNTCTHAYTHTCIHACMHTHTHIHTYTGPTYTYIHRALDIWHVKMQTIHFVRLSAKKYIHTNIHTYIHTYTGPWTFDTNKCRLFICAIIC